MSGKPLRQSRSLGRTVASLVAVNLAGIEATCVVEGENLRVPESLVSGDPREDLGFQKVLIQANVAVQARREHGVEGRVDKAEPWKVFIGQLYARDDKLEAVQRCSDMFARDVGLTHMVAHLDDKLLGTGELVCGGLAWQVYSTSNRVLHGDGISRIAVDGCVVLHDVDLRWLFCESGCVDGRE